MHINIYEQSGMRTIIVLALQDLSSISHPMFCSVLLRESGWTGRGSTAGRKILLNVLSVCK